MKDDQRRLLDQLRDLLQVSPQLDMAVIATVRCLRDAGVTWQKIGQANSMTRQAALMKWGSKARAAQAPKQSSPTTAEEFRCLIAPLTQIVTRPSEPSSNADRC